MNDIHVKLTIDIYNRIDNRCNKENRFGVHFRDNLQKGPHYSQYDIQNNFNCFVHKIDSIVKNYFLKHQVSSSTEDKVASHIALETWERAILQALKTMHAKQTIEDMTKDIDTETANLIIDNIINSIATTAKKIFYLARNKRRKELLFGGELYDSNSTEGFCPILQAQILGFSSETV